MGLGVEKYKIPNNFEQEDFKYLPSYLRTFSHFKYFNTDEPFTDLDFDDWVLGLFKPSLGGTPVEVLDVLQKDDLGGGEFRVYGSIEITASVTGSHYFAIYNSVTEEVKYQTNMINIIGVDEVEDYTLVEYRHSNDLDFINYDAFSEYQSVFLHMDLIEDQFEHTNKGYRERSTGEYRHQKNQRHKRVVLETYLFDEAANDAMGSLSLHDDILLNKEAHTVKEAHEHDNNKDFQLSNGRIVFYVNRFSTINRNQ